MSIERFSAALESEFSTYVFGESPRELYEPLHYILDLGGKRIRPLLTLLSAHLFQENWEAAIKPAMAVEVFHNFTLMHDDIMDQAPLRRGKPTVHQHWDTNRAILSGDVMLVSAYSLLADLSGPALKKALLRFNTTAAEVCEGQQFDMLFADRTAVRKEDYLEMIRLKTSVLVGFALELGGILAGAEERVCRELYTIGENLGLGFQMTDDILDVYADPKVFGKQVGGDIIENKKTWLLLRAMEKAEGSAAAADLQLLLKDSDKVRKVEGVRELFTALNIREEANAVAHAYFEQAEAGLINLDCPRAEQKPLLAALFNQIRNRQK
jgi:geranylgeranyl diphosphate synthase type II